MEHESFRDPEVARLMNETFVSIKVDREERPDIDGVYMTVSQMMTGRGGWPLTIIMTPEKKPFFAATYIPRTGRFGRMGMVELIPRIEEAWRERREKLLNVAEKVTLALEQVARSMPGDGLDETLLGRAYEELVGGFDAQNGGFGDAPKFPTPHRLLFLLRYWKRTGQTEALEMVEKTLGAMRLGGIYDQVGFGFHRYSTDSGWLVPHFEKMLYDQALLAMAYIEAYQATGNEIYAATAREVFTYVRRDMSSAQGGFYTAEDADSEDEEGKFYVWTLEEIREALPAREANLIIQIFNVQRTGNFTEQNTGKMGANILHLRKPLTHLAADMGLSEPALRKRLADARKGLFDYRANRVRPHRDDKIMVDWNGLMIAALAKGAQVLDEPKLAETAARAVDFILGTMRTSEGRLLHRYRDGQAAIPAYLGDHAFLIWGLLELYEVTFEVRYLRVAMELTGEMIAHFWDERDGGFYSTADDAEQILIRRKEIDDAAVPSGNSVAMWNLLRLARISGNADYEDKAQRIGRSFSGIVRRLPSAFAQLLVGADFGVGPAYEVVIAGDPAAEDTKAMLRALRTHFLPNKVVILRPSNEQTPEITRVAEFTRYQTSVDGRATAYVCQDFSCRFPTRDIERMLELLDVRRLPPSESTSKSSQHSGAGVEERDSGIGISPARPGLSVSQTP
jgi:uncharacterized protein YyaL (SSP411 family)